MAKILREMYLSFMEEEWILPSDILSQLGLKFFIRISEDIKAEVKAAIYQMVTILNDDKMPKKVIWVDAKLLKVDVTRQ